MNGIKIGKLFGIPIEAQISFIGMIVVIPIIIALISGFSKGVELFVFFVFLFTIVVCHELGHALAARRMGIRTKKIILLPMGAAAVLDEIPKNPKQELLMALAGPMVNLVFAIVFFAIGFIGHEVKWLLDLCTQGIVINLILFTFNLLVPAFPLDGGRVLRAILAMRLDRVKATWIAARIGQVLAVVMAIVGVVFLRNPLLVFVGIFISIQAQAEAQAEDYAVRLEKYNKYFSQDS